MDTSEPEAKKVKSYSDAIKSTNADEILQAMMAGYSTPDNKGMTGNASGGALGTGSHPPAQMPDCPTQMSSAMKQQERETQMVSDGYQLKMGSLERNFGSSTAQVDPLLQGERLRAQPSPAGYGLPRQSGQGQGQGQTPVQSPAQGSPVVSEASIAKAIAIALKAVGLNCGNGEQ